MSIKYILYKCLNCEKFNNTRVCDECKKSEQCGCVEYSFPFTEEEVEKVKELLELKRVEYKVKLGYIPSIPKIIISSYKYAMFLIRISEEESKSFRSGIIDSLLYNILYEEFVLGKEFKVF